MASLKHILRSVIAPRRQAWRWGLPIVLVLLFLAILIGLPWQAHRLEDTERQQQLIADTLWVEQTIRFQLSRNEESLLLIASEILGGQLPPKKFYQRAAPLLSNNHEIKRLVWLDAQGQPVAAIGGSDLASHELTAAQEAAAHAQKSRRPSYVMPTVTPGASRPLLIRYYIPMFTAGRKSTRLNSSHSH